MVFGKLIAGVIGLIAGGVPGLLGGLLLGHLFDRALARSFGLGSPEQLAKVQESFFEATFLLSGHLAKADGRISEQEVAHMEAAFRQLGLSEERRRRAIELFHRGAAADFRPEATVAAFRASAGRLWQLRQALLLFLVALAHADRTLEPAEHAALVRIAGLLGVGAAQLEALLRMARAQDSFHGEPGAAPGATATLEAAYAALDVSADCSERELKQAYRRRMSENHPDKLMARGLPQDMVQLATERTQEIQAAYAAIRKARGGAGRG